MENVALCGTRRGTTRSLRAPPGSGYTTVTSNSCMLPTPAPRLYTLDGDRSDRFVADQGQYLRIHYRDGRKEHMRGPCAEFMDPILHTDIQVLEAICLDAFEAVIVYRETSRSDDGAALASPTNVGVAALVDQGLEKGPVEIPVMVRRPAVVGVVSDV